MSGKSMKLKLFFVLISLVILSFPVTAKDIVCTKRLNFNNINHEDRVVGIIKGYDTKNYKFNAKKGQILKVSLESEVVHFNVYAPNKERIDGAMFEGSSEGMHFTNKLKKGGIYTVQVYLSDEEAEKKQKVIFTLDIGLE
jgi:hypothetical protein